MRTASDDRSVHRAEIKRLLASDPAKAEALARDVLRENPDEPDALLMLAIALRKKGATNSARTVLEGLVDAQPQMAPVHYELGLVLATAGDNRGATASLRRAVDLDPGFARAWHALGDQLTRMHSKGAEAAYAGHFYASVGDPRLREAMTAYREDRMDEAERLLLTCLESDPARVNALKLLGEIALRGNRPAHAENFFKRCVELAPDFAAARFRYATVLMTQNKLQDAIDQIDLLLVRDTADPYHRNLKAAALIRMSAFAEAAAEYEILLKEFPNQPGAWLAYGHALKAMGRREQCIAAYRTAMRLLPGLGDAYWSLANLKVFRFSDAEVDAMRAQLARADLKGENRGRFHFALGKALEDLGQYAQSFEHYRRGNELIRAVIAYDPDETTQQVRRAKVLYTRAFFAERAGSGCPAADPIFVVGMPRSGSTLIEQILASHSAVEGTTELRAMPYLAGRLGGKTRPGDAAPLYPGIIGTLDAAALKSLGEEYLWRARQHRRLGRPLFIDKMPGNFAHIGLIRLILPNARIIDVRRHPLACCLSNFKQHFGNGQLFSYGLGDLGRAYFDYVELMAHFDAALPGKIHRVFYEDLVAEPEKEVRALLDHIGLPFEDACLRFHENKRVVRSASAEQVRLPLFTDALDHWRYYEPWLQPLKSALGFVLEKYPAVPEFYSRLRATLDCPTNWDGEQRWSGRSVRMDTAPAIAR